MKILFVINTLGKAGAEVALLELLRRLAQTEYELSLYVMLAQGELADELPDRVQLLNSDYRNLPVLSRQGRIAMGKKVCGSFFHNGHLMRKIRIFISNLLEMAKSHRIQIDKLCWRIVSEGAEYPAGQYDLAVAYLEGASTYFVAEHVKAAKKAAFLHIDYINAGYTRKLDRDCYLVFDRVFMVSDEVKTNFLRVYPECEENVRVFHNLIAQDKIRARAEESGGFTDDFSGMRLLTVGRLTQQKAYDLAVLAMKKLKEEGIKARWYVLGEGSQRSALEKQIASLGLKEDFILMGAVDNPFPYYKQCDLYVHATRFEGKSIAIQEAQTLGCAVLASDCSGNREQIVDGVDGRFCCLTPEGIASGIMELLTDDAKRKRLGQAASGRTMAYQEEIKQLLELLP